MVDAVAVRFQVCEPSAAETPVVVEVPHAGLQLEAVELASLRASASSLARDADLYVDELYAEAPLEGATLLRANVSRYVCDLNRGEQDVDGQAVEGATGNAPHGLVWHASTEGQPALYRPLTRSEYEHRLQTIYRPYHQTLEQLLLDKLARFGFAILLCGHSMPSRGRRDNLGRVPVRADVVPGSRGRTSAGPEVIQAPDELARACGWSVAHDEPYRGGFSTGFYGRPKSNIHAVQVELARRLYMDERTLERKAGDFERTREYCRTLVARLGELKLP